MYDKSLIDFNEWLVKENLEIEFDYMMFKMEYKFIDLSIQILHQMCLQTLDVKVIDFQRNCIQIMVEEGKDFKIQIICKSEINYQGLQDKNFSRDSIKKFLD